MQRMIVKAAHKSLGFFVKHWSLELLKFAVSCKLFGRILTKTVTVNLILETTAGKHCCGVLDDGLGKN